MFLRLDLHLPLLLGLASVLPSCAKLDSLEAIPEAALDCLAGLGEEAGSCTEDTVEDSEEQLALGVRTELLQYGVELVPAKGGAKRVRPSLAGSAPRERPPPVEDAAADQSLAQQLSSGGMPQAKAVSRPAVAEAEVERPGTVTEAAAEARPERSYTNSAASIDCDQHPMFCHSKLRCKEEPLSEAEQAGLRTRLASPEGQVNLRAWCAGYPMYAMSVQKCILEGDLEAYSQATFESQKELNLLDADAAYCFAAGHCNNTELTSTATMHDGTAVCDEQFGRETWTTVGWNQMEKAMNVASAFQNSDGGLGSVIWADRLALIRNLSATSAMTACAMGNLHCDVAYCRQSFCASDLYRERYGNLSWAV